MRRRTHDYYFKSWVRQKIPALGGMTPYQASKSPEGRKKLEKLFDYMEKLESGMPLGPKMDFNPLKKKLGLA